jgi:hypothetical protein
MQLNIQKTKIIFFTCKTNGVPFKYCGKDISVLRFHCINDLGVMLVYSIFTVRH